MSPQTTPNSSEAKSMKPESPDSVEKPLDLSVETAIETPPLTDAERERARTEILEEIDAAEHQLPPKSAPAEPMTAPPPPAKSEALIEIEKILEEDLQDAYVQLTPDVQKKFKNQGESVAAQIDGMLQKGKVRAHKIFKLILHWLKIIPGVNKFFIRQEAKIKTDKIIDLHNNPD